MTRLKIGGESSITHPIPEGYERSNLHPLQIFKCQEDNKYYRINQTTGQMEECQP